MSRNRVSTRTVGLKKVIRQLDGMAERADNVESVWPKVGAYLSRTAALQWATNGAFQNYPWAPLKPGYRLSKIRQGFPADIEVRTGKLKHELTGRPMDIEHYEGNKATFGTNDPVARWQNFGTHRHKDGKRILPPRKLLVITQTVKSDLAKMMSAYVVKGRK